MTTLHFKLLTPTAVIPSKAYKDDAGYDLSADLGLGEELTIFPGRRALIETNVAACPPEGSYLRVAPRSGLAHKNGVDVLAGVVDRGYRDGIGVILLNTGSEKIVVKHGDKVAQVIPTQLAPVEELIVLGYGEGELPESSRGTKGYGSSGR